MDAWILEWDWTGDYATKGIDKHHQWILNGRLPLRQVVQVAEVIYLDHCFSLEERLEYAKRGKFYRHMRECLLSEGRLGPIPYSGSFIFGRNPFLNCQIVRNLRATTGGDGQERIIYELPEVVRRHLGQA